MAAYVIPAAEALTHERRGVAQELVDARDGLRDQLAPALGLAQQRLEPIVEGVARQEPSVHQAQLGARDEHDLDPLPPEPLGASGAVGEQ
jgi:hypothetical protein